MLQGFQSFLKRRAFFKLSFIVLGLASTIWFLVRVIPKPSRASYPCIRASTPLMSSFVIWLIALFSSSLLFKKSLFFLKKAKYGLAAALLLGALITAAFSALGDTRKASAKPDFATASDFTPNDPYGEARGIFPGRVVWNWNPDATREASTNSVNKDGWITNDDDVYYLPKNNDEAVIDQMLEEVMLQLTGAADPGAAWDSVFRYHNRTVNKVNAGYTNGETIYIKTNNQGIGITFNMNSKLVQKDGIVWYSFPPHMTATSPYAIVSTLKQLIHETGIPGDKIYIGDPHNNFNSIYYNIIRSHFSDVHIIGINANDVTDCESMGRTLSIQGTEDVLFYSDKGSRITEQKDKLYKQLQDADYIVNIAAMKSHIRAGISLFCKSHFGSHTRSSASHLHPGLVSGDDIGDNSGYGKYRVLTDIMGHEDLGGKTIICILDALWGGPPHELDEPRKWDMPPFNGDWTSSLFASIDPVAIASVAFDFLRTEYNVSDWGDEAYPNIAGVDDYLHQAADAQFWPEGIIYDPENDGTPIGSLGTHEHWNDAINMQYSRNLDPLNGTGIELIKVPLNTAKAGVLSSGHFDLFPNPASNHLNLSLSNAHTGDVILEVFNLNGRLVQTMIFNKSDREFRKEIELNRLKSGIYLFSVRSGTEKTTRKIMIK